MVNYEAGNVMDYTRGKVDPLEDITTCAELIRSFCIKDHRMAPVDNAPRDSTAAVDKESGNG